MEQKLIDLYIEHKQLLLDNINTIDSKVIFGQDFEILSATCNCPRGQVICHHMAALLCFGHDNVSVTDKECSWSTKTASKDTEVKTCSELYPLKICQFINIVDDTIEVKRSLSTQLLNVLQKYVDFNYTLQDLINQGEIQKCGNNPFKPIAPTTTSVLADNVGQVGDFNSSTLDPIISPNGTTYPCNHLCMSNSELILIKEEEATNSLSNEEQNNSNFITDDVTSISKPSNGEDSDRERQRKSSNPFVIINESDLNDNIDKIDTKSSPESFNINGANCKPLNSIDNFNVVDEISAENFLTLKETISFGEKLSKSFNTVERLKELNLKYKMKEQAKEAFTDVIPKDFDFTPVPKSKKSKRKNACYVSQPVCEIEPDSISEKMECFFTHIESPSEFYVCGDKDLHELLHIDVNEYYAKSHANLTFQSKQEARSVLGDYCIANILKNRAYYRVHVYDWIMHEDDYDNYFVLVYLIDFGERIECSYKSLLPMNDLHKTIPQLAIKCHFQELYPANGSNSWSSEVKNFLINLSGLKSDLKIFIVTFVNKTENSFGLDLYQVDLDKSVAQILIDNHLAIDYIYEIEDETPKLSDSTQYSTTDEDELSFDDIIEVDDINEAVTGYNARDEARICPFTNNNGRCYKGPKCKLEHAKPSSDWVTTDKVLTSIQAFNLLPLPREEEEITIVMGTYINCCRFYVQIVEEPGDDNLYDSKLSNLLETINSKAYLQTYKHFNILPANGELVLFKNEDGIWWRGRFLDIGEKDNTVEIFAVDFGSQHICKIENVRQIPEELLHLPFQAVDCILSGYQEKPNINQEDCEDFFQKMFFSRKLKARVLGSNCPLRLEIREANDIPIGFILQNYGYVNEAVSWEPDADCIVQTQ